MNSSFVCFLKRFVSCLPAILSLQDASLMIDKKVLLEKENVHFYGGDKICLVGRNGCGKSSMLRVLAGYLDLEDGKIFRQPGLKIAYLPQNFHPCAGQTIEDFVRENISEPHLRYQADDLIQTLRLTPTAVLENLSGGELRRACLARTLLEDSDITILDEPTNHLDIWAIEWLESWIQNASKAFVIVAHDRRFLKNTTRKTLWMENGRVHTCPWGFDRFEEWQETFVQEQQRIQERLDVHLAQEMRWLARGITARRARNEGRLRKLHALREQKASFVKRATGPSLKASDQAPEVRQLMDIQHLSYTHPEQGVLFKDLNFRLLKGERLGIIGPNGCGKSTLIHLLTGQIPLQEGAIRKGSAVQWQLFQQNQPVEDMEKTAKRFLCPAGGDYLRVQGRDRHVAAYMKEFLFHPDQIHQPLSLFSGGERNRLRLAKILAQGADCLVLDEPTNDLDVETLDFLKNFLIDYQGTLMIVSHDRDFLDDVVSSLLVFEAQGQLTEYLGGFSDYMAQSAKGRIFFQKEERPKTPKKASKNLDSMPGKKTASKLSYHEARLLEVLPAQIHEWQEEKTGLEAILNQIQNSPDVNLEELTRLGKKIFDLASAICDAEDQWLQIAEKQEILTRNEG